MPILKIGIQTLSFRRPLRRALEAAGRAEADGVEIDLRTELPTADLSQTATRQLRKLLDDLGLSVAAATFPLRRGLGDPADLDRRVAALMNAMTAAAKLGARVVTAPIGPIPAADSDNPQDTATRGQLIESLTAIGAHGDRVGARLAIATGADNADDLNTLIEEFPGGVLGAALHPARLLAAGHDPIAFAQQLGPAVLHAHAADAVRDLAARSVVDVPLGRGSIDFLALLATLEQHEYRGWVTVERNASPDPDTELADAVAYLRTLLRDG